MIEDLRLSFGKILDFLQLTTCSLLFFGIVKLFSSVGKIAWLKLISQQQARNMNGPQGLQVDSPDLLDILILNMKYVTLFWNHAKYRDISHLSATSDFILEHLAWYLCWSSRYRSSTVLMAAHTKCHYQACGCSWIHFPSARGFCILSRWRACPVQRTFVDSKRYNLLVFVGKTGSPCNTFSIFQLHCDGSLRFLNPKGWSFRHSDPSSRGNFW